MNIIIIIKQPLERIPPIISLIDVLIKKNIRITLICTKTSNFLIDKYKNDVQFFIVDINIKRTKNKIFKIFNWLKFRYKVLGYLKENLNKESILWIASADAAIALGPKLISMNYIFQCHELYDALPFYKKRIKKIMQNALINITPEENRAAIFRSWFSLKSTPYVLPNKALYHPQMRNLEISDNTASQIINKIKDKKIVIYQGGILKKRDVSYIAEAIESISQDWVLVLMGHTDESNYLSNILKKYPSTVYIPPIAAPEHLTVTSWAHIGLVSYSYHDLNHVFCAPNKTWEYSGFGIPMLGNNVPGITNNLERYKSGISLDLENTCIEQIINTLKEIDNNYDYYKEGALNYYNSIDLFHIIEKIIVKYEKLQNKGTLFSYI